MGAGMPNRRPHGKRAFAFLGSRVSLQHCRAAVMSGGSPGRTPRISSMTLSQSDLMMARPTDDVATV